MKKKVLRKMHNVSYAKHPRYQKTIAVVRSQYFWPRIKTEMANYISRSLEFQKVNTKHKNPIGLLYPLLIP
jgi:hypothetical protein